MTTRGYSILSDLSQVMVQSFHRAMDIPVGDYANPCISRPELRLDLIKEEVKELEEAIVEGDLIKSCDALADILYVVLGTAVEFGVDLYPVFREVHAANMAKVGGPKREDGKQLKPEGWQPPDIISVVARQIKLQRDFLNGVSRRLGKIEGEDLEE